MTNKELNMAILSKLYEIAETIWQKMVRNNQGSYRASEIAKNLDKIFFWGEEISMYQPICVEVDSFRCEFTAGHIFRLVSKFESLVGIGKNAHMFTYQEENEKERGCVCFQATKEMAELCDFVYKGKDRGAFLSIFIDAERSRLVATDTHKLLAMPVTITNKSGDTREMLINAKTWKKMCAKMKKGETYDLVAVKLDNREEDTVIEFEGLTSYEPTTGRYYNWASCFGNIFDGYCVRIGGSWEAIRKMIWSVAVEEYAYLSGKKGEKVITVKVGENVATFATDEVLKHSFSLSFYIEHLLSIPQLDILYLGINEKTLKMAESKNGNVYLLCPREDGNSYIGEKVADGVYDEGKSGKGANLLQNGREITAPAAEEEAEAAPEVTLLATVPSDSIAGQEKKTSAPSFALSTDASRFEPMCACLPASLIITLSVWDKTVGARKMRHLVCVTVKAMPPPGNKRFFLLLHGERGRAYDCHGLGVYAPLRRAA